MPRQGFFLPGFLECELLATLGAAAREHFASLFGAHPGTEAVNLGAAALFGLICAFGHA